MDVAEGWERELSTFAVKDRNFEDDEFVDEYLSRRDSEPFDTNWVSADKRLTNALELIEASPEKDRLAELCKSGREKFYMTVIRQTKNPDLAAYASDDIELIIGFLATGEHDAFALSMKKAYDAGTFPLAE